MTTQLRGITLTLIALVFPIMSCSAVEVSPAQSAQELASKLSEVRGIEFYFLSRTEDWDYTVEEIISNSSIEIRRSCGANCHNFMEPVLAHLRSAQAAKCLPGQQDALIRSRSGHDLVNSYSGRQVRYRDQCFFNEHGVRAVVAGNSMIF